jgi:hypothetical protein
VRSEAEGVTSENGVRARVRFDFKGVSRRGRFLLGSKPTDRVAEESREQHVALFRNVPVQGIRIEDIDMGGQIYTVFDESSGAEVAFAPVEITLSSDNLEDIIRFVSREEFRRIEVLSPPSLLMSRIDIERLIFKVHEEMKHVREWIERKYVR